MILGQIPLKITVPPEKLQKLLRVEAVAGHLLWISETFPCIRWSLGNVYIILSRPRIQLVWLNKDQIRMVLSSLNDSGQLTKLLHQPYIPQGSILSCVGRVHFYSGQLQRFKDSCFDLSFAWASFWNCRSNRVPIFEIEADLLLRLYSGLSDQIPRAALSFTRRFRLEAGADAFATETEFGLGAWLNIPGHASCWINLMGTTPETYSFI